MWYNRLSAYQLKHRYENDIICPCIFIKKSESRFLINAVYVDDLNPIETLEEIIKTEKCLKDEFEMKDLRPTAQVYFKWNFHSSNDIY